MSGIVGLVNGHPVATDLVEVLSRLGADGTDNVSLIVADGSRTVRRAARRADMLRQMVQAEAPAGRSGIAKAGEARPHSWSGVSVVLDGVIGNAGQWRRMLESDGHVFRSFADGEVAAHVIAEACVGGIPPHEALRMACEVLEGNYTLVVLFDDRPGLILVAGHGGKVAVADGSHGSAVVSDAAALSGLCQRYAWLEDGDIAELSDGLLEVLDSRGEPAVRLWHALA